MTIKEMGSCEHVRRGDRVVEFKKDGQIFHAICPKCGTYMKWDNWTKLSEPLRAKCTTCGLCMPNIELNLQFEENNTVVQVEGIKS